MVNSYRYEVDGVIFETDTINANFKLINVYTRCFSLGCFWITNNQSEYLKKKILNCCLKDILNVCTILNKKNDRWDYLKYVIN